VTVVGPAASQSIYHRTLPYPARYIDLPSDRRGRLLQTGIELLRARFHGYDCLYINSIGLARFAAILLAGPRFGKRLVYHNPDYICPFTYPWGFRLEGRLCRKVDLYINNEFHRAYITRTMHRVKKPTLTAPPNLPRAWPVATKDPAKRAILSGGRDDAFVLMLHGSYSPIRMGPELVRALTLLPDRFRLAMTGGGSTPDKVDAELQRLGIAHRIVRLGFLDFNDMLAYSVNANAGVLFYSNNDLGNFFTAPGRLTEYLSSGLPVLGSDHTGLENIILRHQLGETADTAKPESIAQAIQRLADRAARNEFLPSRLRAVFDEHLAFDHWEPIVVQAMDDMLQGKPAAHPNPPFPWLPNS
jgi:glycosyltransferase involved in cell wall biosynthesis